MRPRAPLIYVRPVRRISELHSHLQTSPHTIPFLLLLLFFSLQFREKRNPDYYFFFIRKRLLLYIYIYVDVRASRLNELVRTAVGGLEQ